MRVRLNLLHLLKSIHIHISVDYFLQVIERLPPHSVLFLFGDHGMTDQGEHGGSSQHETESGLFVYSTEPMFTVHTNSGGTNGRSNESNPVESTTTKPGTCNTNSINTNNSIHTTSALYWNDTTLAFEHTPLYNILTAPRVVPQIDFTSTIATLLVTIKSFAVDGSTLSAYQPLKVLLLMGALFLLISLSYVGLALFLYSFYSFELTRRGLDLKASSKVRLSRNKRMVIYALWGL